MGDDLCLPVMLSTNYTCSYNADKVVEELKGYTDLRAWFLNEGAVRTGFLQYIRKYLTNVHFVDITDEVEEIKAIESPEGIECIKRRAQLHDDAMKACFGALRLDGCIQTHFSNI